MSDDTTTSEGDMIPTHDTTPSADSTSTPTTASTEATPPVRRSGRPILGAIAGFFLGVFLWIDLVLVGVIAFESITFWIFPVVGVIAGWALARWTPFGRTTG